MTRHRLFFIFLFAVAICINVSAWKVDQYPTGDYYLYDGQRVTIRISDITGELIIRFFAPETDASFVSIELKEEDGTVHTYDNNSTGIFENYEAIEIYDIILRNGITKIHTFYYWGSWGSGFFRDFNFEVSNASLAFQIDELRNYSKYTQNPRVVNKEFMWKDGESYILQVTDKTSALPYSSYYLIDFSILKYSHDKKFTAMYISGDRNLQRVYTEYSIAVDKKRDAVNVYDKIILRCGSQEEVFSRESRKYALIDSSSIMKLDSLLSEETTIVSIPYYSVLVEVSTDELRSLLGLGSLAEKKEADAALLTAEKAEAKAKRKALGTSTSFSLTVGLENTIGNSTANPESPFSGGNLLFSLRFTKLLFNSGFAGVSVDGSFGNLGNSFGASADIGMGFSILQFGLRVPVRFSMSDSKIDKVIPQLFAEGFIPLRSGGLIVGFQFGLVPKDPGARAGIYIGYSFKSREGSFTTWNYKQ